ncbi:MAG: GNAT family N-acetyltransferase [Brooklawnia sp.]|jgi:predicted GNAT family acetyltransferase
MSGLEYLKNTDGFRYELWEGSQLVSQVDYLIDGNTVSLTHTGTPAQYRGRGLAAKIVEFALDDIRDQGQRVEPLCPYVASYIADNPEYADLVATRV